MKTTHILLLTCALAGCSYMPSWLGGGEPEKPKHPGDRQTIMAAPAELAADPALQSLPFSIPPVYENAASGPPATLTGNLVLPGTLERQQSAPAGDGDSFEHMLVPRPVVAEGTVFAMDAEGHISAHDAANIDAVRWKSKGVADDNDNDTFGGGLAYEAGRLYATSGRGVIAAFDAATGNPVWRKDLRTPIRSAPRVGGSRVYAITLGSQLVALDAATGEALWSHRGIGEVAGLMNDVSPAVADGAVIAPYPSGELFALNAADGRPLWGDSLAGPARTQAGATFSGIGGDPAVDSQVVFAGSGSGKFAVFALATGQKLWEKPVSSINTPWLAGDYLFLLTTDNTLLCLVKYDGRVRWSVQLPGYEDEKKKKDPILWRGPVLAGGKLIVTGSHGEMKLVSPENGSVIAMRDIPEDIVTAPVVAGGRLYLVGQNAKLYALW